MMPETRPHGNSPGGNDADPGRDADIDAAKALLNRLVAVAREKGHTRVPRLSTATMQVDPPQGRASAEGRDPQQLGNVMQHLVRERGWNAPVAAGSVFTHWPSLVGDVTASHSRPRSFDQGTLVVQCDSTAWATQLRMISHEIMTRLNEKLGAGMVERIKFLGPHTPAGFKGVRRVKGRGVGDTYG